MVALDFEHPAGHVEGVAPRPAMGSDHGTDAAPEVGLGLQELGEHVVIRLFDLHCLIPLLEDERADAPCIENLFCFVWRPMASANPRRSRKIGRKRLFHRTNMGFFCQRNPSWAIPPGTLFSTSFVPSFVRGGP